MNHGNDIDRVLNARAYEKGAAPPPATHLLSVPGPTDGGFKVTPNGLRAAGKMVGDLGERVRSAGVDPVQLLLDCAKGLHGWDSEAALQYASETWGHQVDGFREILFELEAKLNATATAYEKADQAAASSIPKAQ
ncbi:WXG100 family type VII secretion target [Yinghuangia seranimata]|uniref:WXG100 family type VII secretion target n=1 Tax=Yinghuangia seranimata TaxID=408067 RepID=UPI00248C9E17|nr:WXG100 family type VII secretion target [Yinghuangia seranimata]MDI2132480.1 WXG100 family type VII secretion target [Yinghuangia seranimata]